MGISVSIGSVSLEEYLEDGDYSLSSELVEDTSNSFTNYDGTEIGAFLGRKNVIKMRLVDVPTATAENISEEIHKESFTVSYTNPLPAQSDFICNQYNADCISGVENLWEIDLTLTSKTVTPMTDGL